MRLESSQKRALDPFNKYHTHTQGDGSELTCLKNNSSLVLRRGRFEVASLHNGKGFYCNR